MAPAIEKFFHNQRFKPSSGLVYLVFFLYIPVGIVLFTFRVLISFQYLLLIALLPKDWLVRRVIARVFGFFMGLHVSCHGSHHKKPEAKVLVSNNVTPFDTFAIDIILPVKQVNTEPIPTWLSKIFKLKKENDGSCPALIYPEQTTTNGEVGLLKFSVDIFKDVDGLIQPIVLTVTRPSFVPVNPNHLRSTFTSDLFWFLYTPFTHYNACFLPVREAPKDKESIDGFIKLLQKDMAFVLEKEATNVTKQDKIDLIKRLKTEEERRERERLTTSSSFNRQINRALASDNSQKQQSQLEALQMIEQIKNVLPQVPVKVIQKELEVVNNVDATISLLLDGTIVYTPLSEEDQLKEKKIIDERKSSLKTKSTNTSSSTLESWKDRQLSFQEKKRLMIQNARRKYLELHPEYT